MRGLILILTILFSVNTRADIQKRISIFTQQTDLFRQICFLPDGVFLSDRILFDAHSSIRETSLDCNSQALALREEYNLINKQTVEQCPVDLRVSDPALVDLLNGTSPIVENIACPGMESAARCANKVSCNMIRSMYPGGAAALRYFSSHPVLSSCGGTGNCLTNIGKAIFDNLWDTVKGLYNIGSIAVNWAGERIGSLWRAEDATSRRGIAATEATDSELDQFMDNPFKYMYAKGQQLIKMITDGISSRYGCAEWTGVPHFSECKTPMSFECADCNEKLNMICGVAGYLGANVVSNFFTGGTVAAAHLAGKVAKAGTFAVARNVPGGARVIAAMGRGSRLGKVTNTVRAAWAGIKNSRTVKGMLSVAGKVNKGARKKVYLYARGQDGIKAATRAYYRINMAAYKAGYNSTFKAAEVTRTFLYNQFPRLSDIKSGRYAKVATPEQYLRESTKNMPARERRHMRVTVTTDSANQKRVIVYDNREGALPKDVTFNFGPNVPPVQVARPVPELSEEAAEEIVVVGRRRAQP